MILSAIKSGIALGLPYLFVAWAAIICRRAAVFNVALEGMTAVGAFAVSTSWALLVSGGWNKSSPTFMLAAVAAIVASSLAGWLFGHLTTTFRLEPIVTGVSVNAFIMAGIVSGRAAIERLPGRAITLKQGSIDAALGAPKLALPVIGIIGTLVLWFFYARMVRGRQLSGVGESEEAARQVGIDIARAKRLSSAWAGLACGVAGISLVWQNAGFSDRMVAGRGFIALALATIGRGNILVISVMALVYGIFESTYVSSAVGPALGHTIPFVATLTLLLVAGLARRRQASAMRRQWTDAGQRE